MKAYDQFCMMKYKNDHKKHIYLQYVCYKDHGVVDMYIFFLGENVYHNDADENNTCPKTKFLGQVIKD